MDLPCLLGKVFLLVSLDEGIFFGYLSRFLFILVAVRVSMLEEFRGGGRIPAYNGFPRQRCWDHLEREVEETGIEKAIAKFHKLYGWAKGAKEKPPLKREKFIQEARNSEFPLSSQF